MIRTQILLQPDQHRLLSEIARQEGRSLSEVVRQMIDRQMAERQQAALAAAAEALRSDYQTNPELTAFQSLDGDDLDA